MYEKRVNLNSVDKVKNFVNVVNKIDCDCDLIAENRRYVIDAKSIMGIFSLDLSKNLTLRCEITPDESIKTALNEFSA